jgi:hypothetical protein
VRPRRRSDILLATVLSAGTAACSIIAVRPTGYFDARTTRMQCTSYAPPVLDLIAVPVFVAGGAMVNAFGRALSECGSHPESPSCGSHLEVYIPALIAAGSAAYGFWGVSHCKNLLERQGSDAALPPLAGAR